MASLDVNKVIVICLVFLVLAFLPTTPSAATVIRDVSGSDNTGAPGDDPGWANVGRRGGLGGAVYLGDRWVLTAAHVGGGTVNFGGTNFSMEGGSWHQLHQPGDPGTDADLGLFRVTGTPAGLSAVAIGQSAPANSSEVLGIGFGRDYNKSETWWNDAWQKETGTEEFRGFELTGGLTKRWGKNHIDGSALVDTSAALFTTDGLLMDFDQTGGAGADEMQAVPGDSGGGLFYKNGSDWELAGIFVARTTYQGAVDQPADTAAYGNLSVAADLSRYRSQILAVIPEPSTLAMLLALGAGCLVWSVWRRASCR